MEGIQPWHPEEMYLFAPEEPNYWVDIQSALETKIRARLAHCSQNDFIRTETDREKFIQEIMATAHTTGIKRGIEYAEAFHKVDTTSLNL